MPGEDANGELDRDDDVEAVGEGRGNVGAVAEGNLPERPGVGVAAEAVGICVAVEGSGGDEGVGISVEIGEAAMEM